MGVMYSLGDASGNPVIDSNICTLCGRCSAICPMDIRLTDYLRKGQRIVCSECILCLTCTNVCPHQLLSATVGCDISLQDHLRRRNEHDP